MLVLAFLFVVSIIILAFLFNALLDRRAERRVMRDSAERGEPR
jgi:preprotein translocase subunit SecG